MLTFKVGTLAKLIGVHRNTVTNWIKKGKLPAEPATAKQYTISEKAFAAFCAKARIPRQAMEQVLSASSMATGLDSARKQRKSVEKKVVGAVCVVGGGVTGIQAALDLADLGYYVYLIEKSAGIGGTMAQLDKTFPTNDCSSCIILPKLVECGRHVNIELITLARVEQVGGSAGCFNIRVRKKPRYVDVDKCIACGVCSQKCPIRVSDPFNFHTSSRKAVYIPYSQSVPLKYAIDPGTCIYLTLGKCRACEKFCPTRAINFEQKDEIFSLEVGAVILAPGFKPFEPGRHGFYGYDMIKDMVTSLEFERLLSVNGPNQGDLVRPSDLTSPKKIAWLQCVGSRNQNNCGHSYCSNICCMSSVKQSLTAVEHTRASRLERVIFFTDLRSHGKESERYFERAKSQGIRFVRALPHSFEPGKDGTGVRCRYTEDTGAVRVESFDMAVLSIGFEAPRKAKELADLFGIQLDRHDFVKTSCFQPVQTSRPGVFVAGAFQSPMSIPRSVIQATAAAAGASKFLAKMRGTQIKDKRYPREKPIDNQTPLLGVFVCACGINIAAVVDVKRLAAYAARLPHVVHVENNLFSCSADAQQSIIERINDLGLNRIVIAACTPRTHEHMFQETLKTAGLNGFMVEMANIRNQNAWVHQNASESATRKAMDQVRMAVAKVTHNYPLHREPIPVHQTALVVGGGLAGLKAALTIAAHGISAVLLEKNAVLGGNALRLDTCFKGEPVSFMLESLIHDVMHHPNITVCTNSFLESASGSVGNFIGCIRTNGNLRDIRFGAAVMTTGAKEAKPDEYLYGRDPRVFTQLEFDEKVVSDLRKVKRAGSVVFIQCVGSREGSRMYCSRVCCIHTVKTAIALKKVRPEMEIFVLYREIRTYGEWEGYYKEARDAGVIFIRYALYSKPDITAEKDHLALRAFDPVIQQPLKIRASYVVLASGVEASDNRYLADLLKFKVNPDGFFNGAHPKLKPVDLSVAGLFLAGLCNYPKPVDESFEEANAAACGAVKLLLQKEMKSEAIKSYVTEKCDGCALCVNACPFRAIAVSGKRISIDLALCQGCGICAGTCPKEGIGVHGFTMAQLRAQVRAAAVHTDGGVGQMS